MKIEPAERKILELLEEKPGTSLDGGSSTRRGPISRVDRDVGAAMALRGLLRHDARADLFSPTDLGRAVLAGTVDRLTDSLEAEGEAEGDLALSRRRRSRAAADAAASGVSFAEIGRIADVSPERARQWAQEGRELLEGEVETR